MIDLIVAQFIDATYKLFSKGYSQEQALEGLKESILNNYEYTFTSIENGFVINVIRKVERDKNQ